ncbi:MAG: hypothetical protein HY381_02670 [Candidatus Chisholmbacteria bacterium]|nr:hypothetical protein [Candidatus Chisholmbacteria bacterium]
MSLVEARVTVDPGRANWLSQLDLGPQEEIGRVLETAGNLGRKQMGVFQAQEGPIWLQIHVGGVAGQIYRVGRGMEYNSFSLAQVLVAKRNDLRRKLVSGKRVEVHDSRYVEGWPRFMYVAADAFDVTVLEAQMAGALSAIDSDRDDYRVRIVLERALRG